MNDLQIFQNSEFGTVRTVIMDNEPWFVGKEVAEILGYKDTVNALKDHVDNEDKQIIQKWQFTTLEIPNRGLTIINESGLYSLILRSKLKSAKRFKRWITSEVLPQIRKTGSYGQSPFLNDGRVNLDYLIPALQELNETRTIIAVQKQQLAEMQPKASYYDVVLNSPDLISVSEFARDYNWSAQKMNKELKKRGIQYNRSGHWFLYQKYAEQGYTHTKTHTILKKNGQQGTKVHMYWTQKGRLFVYDLLKQDGILPDMEKEKRRSNESKKQ